MEVGREQSSILEKQFCRMVDQNQTALLRLCYMQLQDQALAEDAVQETFLKAYRSLDSFRGACSEKTWLTRIAINTCRDMRRSGWFRRVDRHITPEDLPETGDSFQEADEEITLALMNLSRRCREIVLLRYYQQMSIEEVAETLGVSASTVSTQLNRARKKLRVLLEGGR